MRAEYDEDHGRAIRSSHRGSKILHADSTESNSGMAPGIMAHPLGRAPSPSPSGYPISSGVLTVGMIKCVIPVGKQCFQQVTCFCFQGGKILQ